MTETRKTNIDVGISPQTTGPIGVLLCGHNDCGDTFTVGAYGADVFSATDAAREYLERQLWDFSFSADDYKVFRYPERITPEIPGDALGIGEDIDG